MSELFRVMAIQRKMYEANKALAYFTTTNFNFKNENFKNLSKMVKAEDVRSFEYVSVFKHDVILLCRMSVLGFRRYLLKEKDETLPATRRHFHKIEIANKVIKSIPYVAAFYVAFARFNAASWVIKLFEYFEH